MAEETNYLKRLETYRTYLEGEVAKYKEISREESLSGSITADQKVGLLEQVLERLSSDFPELKI